MPQIVINSPTEIERLKNGAEAKHRLAEYQKYKDYKKLISSDTQISKTKVGLSNSIKPQSQTLSHARDAETQKKLDELYCQPTTPKTKKPAGSSLTSQGVSSCLSPSSKSSVIKKTTRPFSPPKTTAPYVSPVKAAALLGQSTSATNTQLNILYPKTSQKSYFGRLAQITSSVRSVLSGKKGWRILGFGGVLSILIGFILVLGLICVGATTLYYLQANFSSVAIVEKEITVVVKITATPNGSVLDRSKQSIIPSSTITLPTANANRQLPFIRVDGCSNGNLRVRSGPGENYPVAGWLTKGGCLSFDGRSQDDLWLHAIPDENVPAGWVFGKWVILNDKMDQLPIVEAESTSMP